MPAGYGNNVSNKKDHAPKRKRSRSRSGGVDGKDDLNYVDEDSDLSSGDEANHTSDVDFHAQLNDGQHHTRKRGRPKSHQPAREERGKSASVPLASTRAYTPPTIPTGYISEYDESGETKVDKYGRLLGGREYRVPTFKLPTRDDTLFMFSKDPAALLGFRDSFVFLKKNPKLLKVHIDNVEKGYLVDSNLLRSTFRTREISVVTARSVFKQFGHRIVKRGRKGRDDYYYTEEVDDEEDQSEEEVVSKELVEKPVSANTFLPQTVHVGKNNLQHKLTAQDTIVNDLNWMHNAAVSARQFNTSLFSYRRSNPTNYDLLTNVYQIPENKQTLRDTGLIMPEKNEINESDTLEHGASIMDLLH
ncbi:chromatin remodelling complex Rsc7/Swp82 subunit-domain-containing protein [Thamnidium elegans]|nr:chromatin remodelling complex Rsc7/Swp82 subunit-domain-containing protein [Thamnidium elegans]